MKSNFIWVLLGNGLTGMQQWSKKERKMAWNPFVCSCPTGSLGSKPGAAEAEKAHEGHQPPQFARDEGFPGCGTFSAKTGPVPGKWDGWAPSSPLQDWQLLERGSGVSRPVLGPRGPASRQGKLSNVSEPLFPYL